MLQVRKTRERQAKPWTHPPLKALPDPGGGGKEKERKNGKTTIQYTKFRSIRGEEPVVERTTPGTKIDP